jgi:mannose-1-phosphate guanylyltransferase
MMQAHGRIVPVLLSGGTGSRLWPLSRETYPKQLLSLLDDKTLLQQTALRVADPGLFAEPMVIANAEHRFVIGEQLRAVGISDPTIVLEPFGRNTVPAVAIAALLASEADPEAVILVLPVDHWVRNHAAFRAAISSGLAAARHGRFVLFGLRPTAPATRFGYIRMGGAKLSLQKHFHRAEHWVVVNGTAIVTRDDEEILLRENESIFVPLGCMHRLENPGKVPLNLIEVQSGAYLGEDDIVRMQDIYHRV